ncbi:hypothetical protein [Frondihabitans australicus]|uniref:Uncharacterized protein n=1 Tax=Frondihabitans australicus TaxID=386892 RepID=A0A495IN19_9MICO|nr:hypothetical protein [Frondihabitans australicus]RKR76515.1 hypothetical protein C8E83_3692 [Frondihabitans australicus]
MDERIANAWDDVTVELSQDEDDDVTVTDEGLTVDGNLFAYLEGELLVIQLPQARADDLVSRGIASRHADGGDWVTIADPELWLELAGESHAFVGEPAVGGQS